MFVYLRYLPLFIFSFTVLCSETIEGIVINKKNNQPIEFVNVLIKETFQGAHTNNVGYFVINNIQSGNYTLQISHISYSMLEIKVSLSEHNSNIFLNIELMPQAINMDELKIVSESEKFEINKREIDISQISKNREQLIDVIAPAEPDVFLSILTLPGVAPISDFSSGMYVRGGGVEQNQILLDDVEIYNPMHFGGMFSTFNTDSIDKANLIKGGFPAMYSGRLSSVLDIKNRDGSEHSHNGIMRLSLISLSSAVEGPWKIGNNSGTYTGSIRRSYFELMQNMIDDIPDYYFYDGHVKIIWNIGQQDKFALSVYSSNDNISLDNNFDLSAKMNAEWGNNFILAQWRHIFNSQLFSYLNISKSLFHFKMKEYDSKNNYLNKIDEDSIKKLISYIPNDNHMIELGIGAKENTFNFDIKNQTNSNPESIPNFEFRTLTSDFFFQDTWTINPYWTLLSGIRLTNFYTIERNLEQSPRANIWKLSPRASVRRILSPNSNVTISYGKYYQFLNIIYNDINFPYHIWIPIDGSLKPSEAKHYILGYKHNLYHGLSFDFEIYYKDMKNLVEYNTETNHSFNHSTTTFNNVFHKGIGDAKGVDLLLLNDKWGFEGFFGYAFCITKRKIAGRNINFETNNSEYYHPKYDSNHQFNIVQSFNISEHLGWDTNDANLIFGVNYSYLSGQPSRIPEKIFYNSDGFTVLYSYLDRVRLPYYSRLDLSFKMRWIKPNYTIEPYMQIINVTNRRNVFSRKYVIEMDENYKLNVQEKDLHQFPMIPFLGINLSW